MNFTKEAIQAREVKEQEARLSYRELLKNELMGQVEAGKLSASKAFKIYEKEVTIL